MSKKDKYDLIYDEKDPAEEVYLGADFGDFATAITNITVTVTRLQGAADGNPSAMKLGSGQVQGTGRAVHLFGGGVDETDYEIRWDVDVAGQKLTLVGRLPVRKKKAP